MSREITMNAVPLGDAQYVAVDCSECGPVCVTPNGEISGPVREHLLEHGCDMSQATITENREEPGEGQTHLLP